MADQAEFNNGDIVRLKSGSPSMTVENNKRSNGEVMCAFWSISDGKVKYDEFSPWVLEKTDKVDTFSGPAI